MLVGGAAAAWPIALHAQRPAIPVIGWLNSGPGDNPYFAGFLTAFRAALQEAGYVEGHNVEIDLHWANGRYAELPALAAELVRKKVAVIAAGGPPAALAAKAATDTIPIVFTTGDDPVRMGLVESFSRPGGNATGVNVVLDELEAKRLGLLREVVPAATTIDVLLNPKSPGFEDQVKDVREAARAAGFDVAFLKASTKEEIDRAFNVLGQKHASALLVGGDPFLASARDQLVELAARQSLPTMYSGTQVVEFGGLISYGIDLKYAYRQAGIYVGRILKGERPSELPVVRPTKFEMAINLKTAKQLNLTLPPGLIAIADEVIE